MSRTADPSAQEVDLTRLSVSQLQELQRGLSGEVANLHDSYTALQTARQKFDSCRTTLRSAYPHAAGVSATTGGAAATAGRGDGKLAAASQSKAPVRKELLVPLTSSLYVSGYTLSSTSAASAGAEGGDAAAVEEDEVLVDIGTGYLMTKTVGQAIAFYAAKAAALDVSLRELESILAAKSADVGAVKEVLTEKVRASQAASA